MLVDYHLHLEAGPFTPEWLACFQATAAARGLTEIGVSEHIYRFDEAQAAYGAWWGEDTTLAGPGGAPKPGTPAFAASWWRRRGGQSLSTYSALIREATGAVPVRLGIEADYFPGAETAIAGLVAQAAFDYVIGSVHWIRAWGFDLLGVPGLWDGHDVDTAYREYFALLGRAARTGLFDIMAHPDLIKVMGYRPSAGLDLDALYRDAAAAFAAGGVAVEVSTAGLRKPVGELYPVLDFLRACHDRGVPMTLASDAHAPGDVGRDFDCAVDLARAAGYRETLLFEGRLARAVPLG